MKFYQIHQLEMLQNVAAMLKSNKELLSAKVPALRDIIEDFTAKQGELHRLKVSNKNIVRVGTLEKKSVREILTEIILKFSGVLQAHYYKNRNQPLQKTAGAKAPSAPKEYNLSQLNRATAENLCKISLQVIRAVQKNKYARHYGVSPEDIKDAEAYYREFAAVKNEPKKRKKELASRNENLIAGIKEGIFTLKNTIDPLMRIATAGNQELSFKYKALRKVLPRGQGRPSDKEAAYRKSRKKKTDSSQKQVTG